MAGSCRGLLSSAVFAAVMALTLVMPGSEHGIADIAALHCPDKVASPAEAVRRIRPVAPLDRHELAY